jgi:predicted Zn-dependent protease with MMP-like domain
VPVEMTRARFEELVADALDLLPEQFASAMNNVVVLVEDRDSEDASLLGLYEGIALTERDSMYGGVLPDRITIYREPLLDMCGSEDEVVHEIAVTVVQLISRYTCRSRPIQAREAAGQRYRNDVQPHAQRSWRSLSPRRQGSRRCGVLALGRW